jgi:hypothetical protein
VSGVGWGVGGMCLLGWMVRGQNKAKEVENWLANLGLHEGMLGMLLNIKKYFRFNKLLLQLFHMYWHTDKLMCEGFLANRQ